MRVRACERLSLQVCARRVSFCDTPLALGVALTEGGVGGMGDVAASLARAAAARLEQTSVVVIAPNLNITRLKLLVETSTFNNKPLKYRSKLFAL